MDAATMAGCRNKDPGGCRVDRAREGTCSIDRLGGVPHGHRLRACPMVLISREG